MERLLGTRDISSAKEDQCAIDLRLGAFRSSLGKQRLHGFAVTEQGGILGKLFQQESAVGKLIGTFQGTYRTDHDGIGIEP